MLFMHVVFLCVVFMMYAYIHMYVLLQYKLKWSLLNLPLATTIDRLHGLG